MENGITFDSARIVAAEFKPGLGGLVTFLKFVAKMARPPPAR
jgi:hypothetical protein